VVNVPSVIASAIAPETWGAAMLVPDFVLIPLKSPMTVVFPFKGHVDIIAVPGAKIVTHFP
jgi:hypothetical protein